MVVVAVVVAAKVEVMVVAVKKAGIPMIRWTMGGWA